MWISNIMTMIYEWYVGLWFYLLCTCVLVSVFVRACTWVMSNDVLAHCTSQRSDILTHNENHMWKCLYGCLLIFRTMSKAMEVKVPLGVVVITLKYNWIWKFVFLLSNHALQALRVFPFIFQMLQFLNRI